MEQVTTESGTMTSGKALMVSGVTAVVDRMKGFVADTDEKFIFIAEWKKQAKATRVQVQDYFKVQKAPLQDELDKIKAEEKSLVGMIEDAEKIAAQAAIAYQTKKEEERRREEERIRKEKEDARLAEAERLDAAGKGEKADALLSKQVRVTAAETAGLAAPKVAGVSFRETWSAEVTDFLALVRAVAVGQAPVDALQANMVYLNDQARKLHERMTIDGVKAVATKSMATR